MDADWLLLMRCKRGDEAAAESFVQKYYPDILRYCAFHSASRQDAEDLTQESFLSAYLHRESIPPGYERQWLCRVAANKAKDYLQSAYQRHTLLPGEEHIPPGLSPPAEETALRRAAAEEIRDLILHMREPYQPVCRLCLLEEKTPEEAALALGRPVKTIHTQLSRGKRMLREALERSGNDDMLSP